MTSAASATRYCIFSNEPISQNSIAFERLFPMQKCISATIPIPSLTQSHLTMSICTMISL